MEIGDHGHAGSPGLVSSCLSQLCALHGLVSGESSASTAGVRSRVADSFQHSRLMCLPKMAKPSYHMAVSLKTETAAITHFGKTLLPHPAPKPKKKDQTAKWHLTTNGIQRKRKNVCFSSGMSPSHFHKEGPNSSWFFQARKSVQEQFWRKKKIKQKSQFWQR